LTSALTVCSFSENAVQ